MRRRGGARRRKKAQRTGWQRDANSRETDASAASVTIARQDAFRAVLAPPGHPPPTWASTAGLAPRSQGLPPSRGRPASPFSGRATKTLAVLGPPDSPRRLCAPSHPFDFARAMEPVPELFA